MEFTTEELDLLREWYTVLQDIGPEYLEQKDHDLASKIHAELGIKFRTPPAASALGN